MSKKQSVMKLILVYRYGGLGVMKMYFLYVILGIGLIIWAFWYDNTDFKPKQKKNGKMTRPYHKRWWLWTIAVILVVGGIGNILGMDDDKADSNSAKT